MLNYISILMILKLNIIIDLSIPIILKDRGSRCMAHGTVKWFNNAKGFGFIRPDSGGEDIFAHYSTIEMDGYRTLKAGQDVNYELNEGAKGHHAASIKPVDD